MANPTPVPLDTIKSNIQKAYNTIYPKYTAWTTPQHPTRLKYVNHLVAKLTAPASSSRPGISNKDGIENSERIALEVGCGTGEPVISLLASTTHPDTGEKVFTKLIGNDLSSTSIKTAKGIFSANEKVSFQEGDMMALSFEANSLSAIVGMYSVIHLPRDEQTVFLERVYTWLKPGGYLLANFGGNESEGNYSKGWLGGEEGEMFWSSWGEEKTVEQLEKIGFELVVREVNVDVEGGADGDDSKKREVPFLWILGRKK
ncbi:S-adenosyl-L-methionine-dependent methyltransferase [Aspergillus crustosus]